jgi:hypothetical protein
MVAIAVAAPSEAAGEVECVAIIETRLSSSLSNVNCCSHARASTAVGVLQMN